MKKAIQAASLAAMILLGQACKKDVDVKPATDPAPFDLAEPISMDELLRNTDAKYGTNYASNKRNGGGTAVVHEEKWVGYWFIPDMYRETGEAHKGWCIDVENHLCYAVITNDAKASNSRKGSVDFDVIINDSQSPHLIQDVTEIKQKPEKKVLWGKEAYQYEFIK